MEREEGVMITVRVSKKTKEDFEALASGEGKTLSGALKEYMMESVRRGKLEEEKVLVKEEARGARAVLGEEYDERLARVEMEELVRREREMRERIMMERLEEEKRERAREYKRRWKEEKKAREEAERGRGD